MKFTAKTEAEVSGLLVDGRYAFEVVEAEDRVSKSGNEMIALKLRIYNSNNVARFVFDYLLEALDYKLRHFADTAGLLHVYEGNSLYARDCVGKKGFCLVATDDSNPSYPPKNIIKDYCKSEQSLTSQPGVGSAPLDDFHNDEIPF